MGLHDNKLLCTPPLPENEVARIVDSVCNYEPSHYAHDAMGNSERFADRFSGQVKCVNGKDWMIYQNGTYMPDDVKRAQELAKVIAQDIEAEARKAAEQSNDQDDKKVKELYSHSRKTRNNPLAMLPLAASDPKIVVDIKSFDKEPHLINCKNSAYDLDKMKAIPHDPSLLFCKQVNANYDPDAKADLWLEFLDYLTEGNQELIDFLARLYGGVGLYGDNTEQVMAIIFGHGKNGKSKFADTLRYVMGSYSDVIRQEVLTANTHQNVKHDLADIRGCRFLLASEPPNGAKLNASIIKELTGGDTIKGRHIYQNSATFKCEGLITLVTNWEPEIEAGDGALKRRLLFIKLNRVVPAEKRDPELGQKLKEEADGILACLIRGRADYLQKGLARRL